MKTKPNAHTALGLAAALLLLGLAGCSSDSGSGAENDSNSDAGSSETAEAETAEVEPTGVEHEVTIDGLTFVPEELTIAPGDTVVWNMEASLAHDVVSDEDGLFKSQLMTEGEFSYTFGKAGEYGYHCTPHPTMVGTVTVEE